MSKQQKPAKGKSTFLCRVELWGGLSVLVSLISLALPWWGIDFNLPSYSWGVLTPAQLTPVDFSFSRLDQTFSANYGLIQALMAITGALAILGSLLKRSSILAAAVTSSAVTDLSFVALVEDALIRSCDQIMLNGESCMFGLFGQGTSGLDYVSWGFKSGFYVYIASGVLILTALAVLQWSKSGGRTHPPSANIEFRPTKA